MYSQLLCCWKKWCLLWPLCSLDKTLLAFALLHFVFQGQTCLLFRVSLDFLLLHFNPLWWKWHLFLVLVLEGAVGLHRTGQLQLLKHQCLKYRLGLLWCWMVFLGKKTEIILSLLESAPKYCISWASQVALAVKNPPAKAGDTRDTGSDPWSGRSPGGGNGNQYQDSCLENPMDQKTWQTIDHRIAKSWTQLKWLST